MSHPSSPAPNVFGTHDEKTLAQLADVGSRAERVALMADGHLGYVMPIGGVAAYDEAVSVVGVGFDIACFTGDTRIFTLDGSYPTLQELEGKEIHVLACRADGRPVPARAIAYRTREAAQLVQVTLDSGAEIRCTPDHQFMLRDGTYRRADELTAGTSLMPLYTCPDKDGYVLVRNNATRKLLRLHWMVFRAGLTESAPPSNGDVLVLHHRNFRRTDNDPSNLVPMTKTAHDVVHARMRDKAHFNTPEFTKQRIAAIRSFWSEARNDPELMARRRATAAANGRAGVKRHPDAYKSNGARGATFLRAFNTDPETLRRNRGRARQPRTCPICGAVTYATSSLYAHAKAQHPAILAAGTRKGRHRGRNSVMERLLLGANNHQVASVEPLMEREDVYCLQVPEYNNFALAAGVFVHNCGNAAIRTDLRADAFSRKEWEQIADRIQRSISFGVGRNNASNDAPVDHPLFRSDAWSLLPKHVQRDLKQKARTQLGTVGSGNHYVDVFADEAGAVWVGVHFGSRGLGHSIASGFLALGQNEPWGKRVREQEIILPLSAPLGHDYWHLMQLAGEYAYAGREWVARKVVDILGGRETELVHNHHNFAWRETHDEREYIVVRKGATPAFPGQRGFVGGSMGDDAVILEGASGDTESQRAALYSTVHGAGRVMSRTEARGKTKGWGAKARIVSPGKVSWEMLREWIEPRGVILRGGGLDEAPHAYRRLPDVLAAQGETVRVLHTLTPIVVVMAGENEFDPYKD